MYIIYSSNATHNEKFQRQIYIGKVSWRNIVRKKSIEERIQKAREEFSRPFVEVDEIVKILSCCLKDNSIDGDIMIYESLSKNIDYKDIMRKYNTNGEGHIIWLEFVEKGHVAVVGAGKDIGFPRNEKRGTWSILSKILNIEWDTSKVIIIPIRGLDVSSVGIKNVDNVLKCRNGVEYCIGQYLIENNIPILNYYQHINYSEKFWNKCKKNNYWL